MRAILVFPVTQMARNGPNERDIVDIEDTPADPLALILTSPLPLIPLLSQKKKGEKGTTYS